MTEPKRMILATGRGPNGGTFARLCTPEAYSAFERFYPDRALVSVWDGPERAQTSDAIDDAYRHAYVQGWSVER